MCLFCWIDSMTSYIKIQEEKILRDIETNPMAATEIVEKELERVDEQIKSVEKKIKELVNEVKDNKVIITTTKWNGWGYDF